MTDREWLSGLFGCMDNTKMCLDGCFCIPCALGYQQGFLETGILGMSGSHCCGTIVCSVCFGWFGLCCCTLAARNKIKRRYQIDEDGGLSCCLTFFCPQCAICQQSREMAARGEFCGGVCSNEAPLDDALPASPPMQ